MTYRMLASGLIAGFAAGLFAALLHFAFTQPLLLLGEQYEMGAMTHFGTMGSHATPSEIAVTQAAYPDHIKTADYSPQIAPSGPIRDALDYRARFPDGRIGSDPGLASPEHGRTIIDAAVPALLKDVAAFTNEVLPEV